MQSAAAEQARWILCLLTAALSTAFAAIQLYGETGDITIKNTKINSWAVNNTGIGYAVRGDFDANGSRTLSLSNVYFGLDEISGNTEFGHVKVGAFSGNTDGTRKAGTY